MDISELASNILENRNSGTPSQPSQIPISGKYAYSIQQEVAKSAGKISAWKAGGTNEKTQQYFNTSDAYFGPIPANVYLADTEITVSSKSLLFPLKGEVEICFSLNDKINDLAADADLVDIIPIINKVHLGLEMPWTQFDQPESGLDYLIADLCGANALLVGSGIDVSEWQKYADDILSLSSGERVITSGRVKDSIIGPLETLLKFAQFCRAHQIHIPTETILATGGVSQCVPIDMDTRISIASNHLPSLNILIVKEED